THNALFWTYALADAVVLAGIGLAAWGATAERRRRRARGWRAAGVFAAAVQAGTFGANLVPRSSAAHPALVAHRGPEAAGRLGVVAVFAVFASGWPGFGGKVGGTISMVPCFLLLGLAVAGVRLTWRRVLLAAVRGLALFAVFALISYLVPATGKSDIGAFAGS